MAPVTLATCVPEAGRLIPHRASVCHRADRDVQILEAIRQHLTRRVFDKRRVTPLITAAVTTVTAEVLAYEPEDNQDGDIALYQAIAEAQDKTAWASELPASVFAELVTELRTSRQGYLEAIEGSFEAPSPISQAGKLLNAIDDFQAAIDERGWGYNEELMALAGHDEGVEVGAEAESESEDEEDGEAAEENTNEEGDAGEAKWGEEEEAEEEEEEAEEEEEEAEEEEE